MVGAFMQPGLRVSLFIDFKNHKLKPNLPKPTISMFSVGLLIGKRPFQDGAMIG